MYCMETYIFFKKMRIKKKVATSAEIVASIDDLLIHILLLLPTRALLLFKMVSRHWFALITDPKFSLLRNPHPNPLVGLCLQRLAFGIGPKFQYVPFEQQSVRNPQFRDLKFQNFSGGLLIAQSCNGLLLCSPVESCPWTRNGYIFNPTTKQFSKLPEPFPRTDDNSMTICGLSLAFDPSRSPYYNVVYLCFSDSDPENLLQIWIYSSKTRKWRKSFEIPCEEFNYENGVYWNGSIHWMKNNWEAKFLHFNLDQESLHRMSRPSDWDEEFETTSIYLGESCDHLHLTRMTTPPQLLFNVYEQKTDYSEWFVKYKVDLTSIAMNRTTRFGSYAFSVRGLVHSWSWKYQGKSYV